jgi:hypothetical protein
MLIDNSWFFKSAFYQTPQPTLFFSLSLFLYLWIFLPFNNFTMS